LQNLLDPAILFFVFGALAGTLRSNLEIPRSISKILSPYLVMALGLQGGFAHAKTGLSANVVISIGTAIAMAFIVPILGYAFLKTRVSRYAAAAVAAAYGLVSAVIFVTAMQYLESAGVSFGGRMAVRFIYGEAGKAMMQPLLGDPVEGKLAFFLLDMGLTLAKISRTLAKHRPPFSPMRS
jgi:hypothetical protein